jgi:predicted DCC family thiol-disulfide oxidoreductase YuxK
VLFDGVCALCNNLVYFILPRDTKAYFSFSSLQSDFARQVLVKHNLDPEALNTFFVVTKYNTAEERILNRSEAGIHVLKHLDGPLKYSSVLSFIPRVFADEIYNAVARNRYAMFGKHESCAMPQVKYASRFIEDLPVE